MRVVCQLEHRVVHIESFNAELMITNALQRMIALEGNFDQVACKARESLSEVQKMPAEDDVIALVLGSDIDAALKLYLNGEITEKNAGMG